jgi:streptogramin lyase
VTKTVKFVVHQGTIKPAVLVGLTICCALVVLSCTTTLGMAGSEARLRDHRPVSPGVVGQAHAEARTIALPVVDGEGLRFRRLSTDEGLSQTKITQIVQDDQGFIWFGTQYGLNRFDGYNFKVFLHDPTDPNSLSGVFANSVFKDRDGALWVGCDQFLNKFNRETETFTQYPVPSSLT